MLRFARVVFALAPSPFLLNAVIQQHLESVLSEYPRTLQEIKNSLYVDHLITGDTTLEGAQQLKHHAVRIFNRAKFTLHKWHSNMSEPEGDCTDDEPSFAKQQLQQRANYWDSNGTKWMTLYMFHSHLSLLN